MKLLFKVDDNSICEEVHPINNPRIREAVRTILFNNKSEIAILHKVNKNEYKLIGGGVEENESLEIALRRETLEESGCEIKDIQELGYIEEYGTKANFVQISHVFISKVSIDTNELHLTELEKSEGSKLCWLLPKKALEYMENSLNHLNSQKSESNYNSRMILKRDQSILKYYLNNIND